jgi:hypothetical protein
MEVAKEVMEKDTTTLKIIDSDHDQGILPNPHS